ncbi:MAG: hypothetical protein AAF721_01950 [Myxococcota bacterium]
MALTNRARLLALAALLACNASGRDGVGTFGGGEATGSGEGTPTAGSTGAADADAESGDDGTGGVSDPSYDVNAGSDVPGLPPGTCGEGKEPLSHIWIANSSENTISKINTESLVEEGRYRTHAVNGDPSRTSVNLNGNVAVANRNGGIAKFFADPDHCVESNGEPGIQTSSGGEDVLAFGEDECMAWSTPMECESNRPAAWTPGVFNEAACAFEDVDFWTVCDENMLLIDGGTGVIKETLPLGTEGSFAYGGAADADGNFWVIDFGASDVASQEGVFSGALVRADYATLEVTHHDLPNGAYGITVDGQGRPFVCGPSVARFSLDTATWDVAPMGSGGGGCMFDGDGHVWHGGYGGGSKDGKDEGMGLLYGFNVDTMERELLLEVPEYTHGVSIDAKGNIWGVTFYGHEAYRVDPATGAVDTFDDLVGAYTYSDMTGVGLKGAGAGGAPAG